MLVKVNPPQLLSTIQLIFQQSAPSADTLATAETGEVGHGRIEPRCLTTNTAPGEQRDWPGLQQVLQVERTVIFKKNGRQRQEVVDGVTRLSPERADPGRRLRIVRAHWQMENRSHGVRDGTFDEERSQVRCGSMPHVRAALRNTVIGL
jgi:hypothetical protein